MLLSGQEPVDSRAEVMILIHLVSVPPALTSALRHVSRFTANWGIANMKRRGFTLIELLVVIAIIAILAAILFPVFVTAKERGRQARCISNQKQLALAFFGYSDDNDGFLPCSARRYYYDLGGTETDPNKIVDWTGQRWSSKDSGDVPNTDKGQSGVPACNVRYGSLWKCGYCRNVAVFNCPSDINLPSYLSQKKNGINSETGGFGVTYSMNEQLCKKTIQLTNQPTTIKLASAVAGRSGQVLFLIHESRGTTTKDYGQNDSFFAWTQGDPPDKIHNNGTICTYADGHAKWLSNSEILDLRAKWAAGQKVAWQRNSYFYGVPHPEFSE